ncbi:MAG: efflux RND transporter periplasmic adaptor subunit [Desulfobacterales bacterium]
MDPLDKNTRILRFLWGSIPWLIVLLILAFIGIMFLKIGVESKRLEQARLAALKKDIPTVKVLTLTLEPIRLEDKINLPGQVEPQEDLWIKAEVFGQVTRIRVKEGQKVRKGQILVEIDDRDYRSRLARIEASYDLIQQEFDRYASLAKKKIAAQNKLDEIEARLKDVTAQRKEAQLALSRTRIAAPIDGRLNQIIPTQGNLLKVGDIVAQILNVDSVKVIVGVPESDVSAFFDLNESTVLIEALADRRVTGKKLFLSYQPRSLARLYDLELLVANPDGQIRPGMFARVELVRAVFENAIVIPLYAVIAQNDERYVFVENEGHAEKRPVSLGVLSGWQVHITAGLAAGDRVVVVGHRLLDEGHAVDVIRNVSNVEEILQP